MAMMASEVIQPKAYIALRLPSDSHHIIQIHPNTTVHLGKYGSFQANDLLGRPFHHTYEILDQPPKTEDKTGDSRSGLRIVPAAELYADIDEDADINASGEEGSALVHAAEQHGLIGQDANLGMRTNQRIVDDPNTQALSMSEIETLKTSTTGSGREIIQKILSSHVALDQKTAFALAKYTLRKTKKYMKRFTVLPLDVVTLANWIYKEKEAAKIMELRQETLALIGSWSNIHYSEADPVLSTSIEGQSGNGRWLVVDETAGLLTAYLAEKMGILYPRAGSESPAKTSAHQIENCEDQKNEDAPRRDADGRGPFGENPTLFARTPSRSADASDNILTVIHPLSQPNLSLLRYFHFDLFDPSPTHPLSRHLKTLSWLQLLDPASDAAYNEPTRIPDTELAEFKAGRRSAYYRKRRRWQRIKSIVDETRQGEFDGLVVASAMNPASILHRLVPLLRGGAQVVVYSPHVEPVAELADLYSTARKTAFITSIEKQEREAMTKFGEESQVQNFDSSLLMSLPTDDFPLDPRLVLTPSVYTARASLWQVLPGRTHPAMMAKGGSEGFIFVGTRVLQAEGKVEARGKHKKRKLPSPGLPVDEDANGHGSTIEVRI